MPVYQPPTNIYMRIAPPQEVTRSILSSDTGTFTLVANAIHWTYLGQAQGTRYVASIATHCTGAGAGTETTTMFVGTTPSAPNGSSQTVTVHSIFTTVTTFSATGAKGSLSPSSSNAIQDGTHFWAGIRCNMGTTQPKVSRVINDLGMGLVLQSGGVSSIPSIGNSFAGGVPSSQDYSGVDLIANIY